MQSFPKPFWCRINSKAIVNRRPHQALPVLMAGKHDVESHEVDAWLTGVSGEPEKDGTVWACVLLVSDAARTVERANGYIDDNLCLQTNGRNGSRCILNSDQFNRYKESKRPGRRVAVEKEYFQDVVLNSKGQDYKAAGLDPHYASMDDKCAIGKMRYGSTKTDNEHCGRYSSSSQTENASVSLGKQRYGS